MSNSTCRASRRFTGFCAKAHGELQKRKLTPRTLRTLSKLDSVQSQPCRCCTGYFLCILMWLRVNALVRSGRRPPKPIQEMIESATPSEIDQVDTSARTPLWLVAERCHTADASFDCHTLLAHGADILYRSQPHNGRNIVMEVASKRALILREQENIHKVFCLLLEWWVTKVTNFDLNVTDNAGNTFLHLCDDRAPTFLRTAWTTWRLACISSL